IVATTPHTNDTNLYDLEVNQPLALVFGNEKDGISNEIEQLADCFVKIPMYGFTESFNISVSAAICLSVLTEKLRKTDITWQLSEEEKTLLKFEWTKKRVGNVKLYLKEFEKRKSFKVESR